MLLSWSFSNALLTAAFVWLVISTNGSLTLLFPTPLREVAYFTGAGLLSKNNEVCKKAGPTKYSCKVYKNGELLKVLD